MLILSSFFKMLHADEHGEANTRILILLVNNASQREITEEVFIEWQILC